MDLTDPTSALSLPHIRYQLIRLEDTVLFHLIERAQFPLNPTIYQPGAIPIPGASPTLSFSDWVLRSQEALQSQIRRFQSPDEHPFFPDALQPLILPPLDYPQILHPNAVNANADIKRWYVTAVLPAICPPARTGGERVREAQENYGSAATADVACLQALSRRIHFGKFVAESKFRKEPERFTALIRAGDRAGIDAAITDAKVEQQVLDRLRRKAEMYGADPAAPVDAASSPPENRKIPVEAVVALYKDYVIPWTKIVEVEYLMTRLVGTE